MRTLKHTIEENVLCRHCSSIGEKQRMADFFTFVKENPDLHVEQAWQTFIRTRNGGGKTSTNPAVDVQVSQETHGLATRLSLTCCQRNRKFKGHKSFCEPEKRTIKVKQQQAKECSQYSLNCASVIASTLNGGSHTDFLRTTKLLGLPYMTFPPYKKLRKILVSK